MLDFLEAVWRFAPHIASNEGLNYDYSKDYNLFRLRDCRSRARSWVSSMRRSRFYWPISRWTLGKWLEGAEIFMKLLLHRIIQATVSYHHKTVRVHWSCSQAMVTHLRHNRLILKGPMSSDCCALTLFPSTPWRDSLVEYGTVYSMDRSL